MSNVFGITARAYRWYADGTETGAAALAAENTALSCLEGAILALRYGVQESGAGSASGASTDDYQLQYSLNGGAFTNVTAASLVCRGFTSAALTDEAATTQRLSAGTGSFIAGEIAETDGLLTDWALTANNFSELLFAIQLQAADVAPGDAITFRVLRNGAVFDTYTVTPTLNVVNDTTLAGSSAGVATAAGELKNDTALAGTAAGVGSAVGTLTTEIRASGASAGVATGAGVLTTEIRLVAATAGVGTATGELKNDTAVAGSSAGVAAAAGILTTEIRLAGSSAGISSASGTLTLPIALVGTTAGGSSAAGVLLTAIQLVGTSAGVAAAVGDLLAPGAASEPAAAAIINRALGAAATAGRHVSVAASWESHT